MLRMMALSGRVGARKPSRKDKQNDARGGHKRGAEKDGSAARVARALRIFAADGLADAHRSGGGDAEWNHVGEGNGVQSDLMAGKRNGPEPADERCHERENANFQSNLHSRGKAERDQAPDALQVRLDGCVKQPRAMTPVVPEEITDE